MTRDKASCDARARLLDAAMRYAAHGWPVFPLHTPTGRGCSCRATCGSTGKHPRTRQGLHDATCDLDQIRTWWRRWPDANLGVATGTASGLLVIDVDLPEGPATFERLEADHGRLPATCTQRTGSGGRQLLFESPVTAIRNRTGMWSGVDVRGDGGYIVVPPSLHASGHRYRWTDRRPATAAPGWLIAKLDRPPPQPQPPPTTAVEPPAGGSRDQRYAAAALHREVATVRAQQPAGHNRNNTLYRASYALGRLVAGGLLDPDQVRRQLVDAGRAVGLPDREVDRTVASGLDRAATRPRIRPDTGAPPVRARASR